jgi:hypothetical protein
MAIKEVLDILKLGDYLKKGAFKVNGKNAINIS